MFGVSLPELLVLMAIVLIVFGPERLPEFARSFGKVMGSLKKQSDALRRELYNSVYAPADELSRDIRASARDLRTLSTEHPTCESPPELGPQKSLDVPEVPSSDDLADHPESEKIKSQGVKQGVKESDR